MPPDAAPASRRVRTSKRRISCLLAFLDDRGSARRLSAQAGAMASPVSTMVRATSDGREAALAARRWPATFLSAPGASLIEAATPSATLPPQPPYISDTPRGQRSHGDTRHLGSQRHFDGRVGSNRDD